MGLQGLPQRSSDISLTVKSSPIYSFLTILYRQARSNLIRKLLPKMNLARVLNSYFFKTLSMVLSEIGFEFLLYIFIDVSLLLLTFILLNTSLSVTLERLTKTFYLSYKEVNKKLAFWLSYMYIVDLSFSFLKWNSI